MTRSPSRAHPLWRRAQAEGNPVRDPGRATFVWRAAGARGVPQLIGDFMHWGREGQAPLTLERAAPGLWTGVLDLPDDAYLEYAWISRGRRVPDPLNPRTVSNGMGELNHYFYMPAGAATPLARPPRGGLRGTLTREVVPAGRLLWHGRRSVHFYQPPTPDPCPLLVVLDGREYRRQAHLPALVDNLIAQRRIQPLALALVENAGPAARMLEYACSETTLAFLLYALLPLARARLNLIDPAAQPGAHGVLGASLGGLMALYAGLRAPQVFGHILSQAGAFVVEGHPFVVWDLIRYEPRLPIRLWLDVGRFDWLLDVNRQLHALAADKTLAAHYQEFNAGHNFPAWRDDLPRGLELMFPPAAGV